MRFLADVNIAQAVITFLRRHGHDVLDAKKDYLTSFDTEIIELAKKSKRIILTRDKDFINLVQLPQHQVPVIVIRLFDQKPTNIIQHLDILLEKQKENILRTSLTIITEESADSFPY